MKRILIALAIVLSFAGCKEDEIVLKEGCECGEILDVLVIGIGGMNKEYIYTLKNNCSGNVIEWSHWKIYPYEQKEICIGYEW